MKPFADIHVHMLPFLDDGPQQWDVAEQMLKMAYQDGVRRIIFTPHRRQMQYRKSEEEIKSVFHQFCERFALADLDLLLGSEVFYEEEMPNDLANGTALTMAGTKYVLTEFADFVELKSLVRAVNILRQSGFVPILAHIERYRCLHGKLQAIDELIDRGARIQINAESVLGKDGFWTKRFCASLLRNHLVDFIATDAHDCTIRQPLLQQCSDYVSKKYGADYERQLFWENAAIFAAK